MKNYDLILATDLDGTFLEGDHQIKMGFYEELLRLKDQIMLIYVTGRPVRIVKQFCDRGYLPYPHFVIGDHGTHIVDGQTFEPIDILQSAIIKTWDDGNQKLRDLLANDPGLQLQPLDPPYRVAYYYDEQQLEVQTLQKIIDAGYDPILSSDMYLDIVPRDVNKGSTLIKLLDLLNSSYENVVTAGDSLNDLSLFQTGLKSVAVGNSEPKLIEAIKELPNVYYSRFAGIIGVMDGLHFFEKSDLFQFNFIA